MRSQSAHVSVDLKVQDFYRHRQKYVKALHQAAQCYDVKFYFTKFYY